MNFLANLFKGATGRAVGLSLLAFLLIAPLSYLKVWQTLEDMGLDLCYRFAPASPSPPELLIVGIDEPSFQEFRYSWPWPRRLHGALVRRLSEAGARLIVMDLLFDKLTTQYDDQLFTEALARAGNVILAQVLEVTQDPAFARMVLVQPHEEFRRAALGVALTRLTPDHDGVVRHFGTQLGGRDTMPAMVARRFRPGLPLSPKLTGLIKYVGPPRSIKTVSYYQILDAEHPLPAEQIKGRIVLVGRMLEASATPKEQADSFYTPFFTGTGQLMAGVEIHGHIIHTLLTGGYGRELTAGGRLLLWLAFLLLAGQCLVRLSPLAGLGLAAFLVALLAGASFYLFQSWNLWVPPLLLSGGLAVVYTGNILAQHFTVAQEKRWLRQALGRYVSSQVADSLLAHPESLELGGEEVEVTVLFMDLTGFTTISEGMAPRYLILLLNEYFNTMTQIILDNQGTVDKFIGDNLMAYWGAPLPLADHAALACQAALKMQEAMGAVRAGWRARGLPQLPARLGLHSGPVVAGNVGSKERFNYTVLGDTVNLASRLEGANRHYGTEIMLSQDTYQKVADKFLMRELDQVQLKGREQPVPCYELLGPAPADGVPPWVQIFAAGRAAYLNREWKEAAAKFQKVLRLKPGDGPAQLFLERCLGFLRNPPPPDWQGIFVLETK